MARKFVYRGKTIEELQSMPIDEFMKLVDSRARRALERISFKYKKLLVKVKKARDKGKIIKTHLREAVILPQWVGLKFGVHTGKEIKEITISPEMVGYRLGQFTQTTGRVIHSGPGVGATRGSKFMPLK
ncbi:MAG: 30S ribosomal protein S19 [Candidatus Micrarchaeia archaeon]